MIVSEILQRIQSLYSHGVNSDDTRLSNRHIYNAVLSTRNLLLTQKKDKGQKISEWSYQTLCIPLILAAPHECASIPSKGCKILRSKEKLPKILTANNELIVESVTTLDGSKAVDSVTWNQVRYVKGNKYAKSRPGWLIRNDYLFVTNERELEIINMTTLLEDPAKGDMLLGICGPTEAACASPLDAEFRIDGDLIEPLIKIVTEELIRDFSQTPEDKFNDSIDNNSNSKKG